MYTDNFDELHIFENKKNVVFFENVNYDFAYIKFQRSMIFLLGTPNNNHLISY